MSGRHLLVIDDQAEMGDLIRKIAEPLGYSVTTTHQPEQAMEIYGDIRPDAIMLDIIMPGKDGIEVVLDLVRRENNGEPLPLLILMSGVGDIYLTAAEKIARGHGWHNLAVLTKPLSVKEVRELLSREPDATFRMASSA